MNQTQDRPSVGDRPRIVLSDLLELVITANVHLENGDISRKLFQEIVKRIYAIMQVVALENDILLISVEYIRRVPPNVIFKDEAFYMTQQFFSWLIEQNGIFKQYLEKVEWE